MDFRDICYDTLGYMEGALRAVREEGASADEELVRCVDHLAHLLYERREKERAEYGN